MQEMNSHGMSVGYPSVVSQFGTCTGIEPSRDIFHNLCKHV